MPRRRIHARAAVNSHAFHGSRRGLQGGVGVTRAEIGNFVLDDEFPAGDCELTPASLAWPMGFGWSSCIARSYMVDCCLDAGFEKNQLLTEERCLLPQQSCSLSVATDDVIHFLRATPLERKVLRDPPLTALVTTSSAGICGICICGVSVVALRFVSPTCV